MEAKMNLTKPQERQAFLAALLAIYHNEHTRPSAREARKLADFIESALATNPEVARNEFGLSRIVLALQTIRLAIEDIGLRGHALTAYPVSYTHLTLPTT